MTKEFWTITEVVELFQVDKHFLEDLEEEEVVCPVCRQNPPTKVFSTDDLERLRLAKVLVEEMGVNLAGVEVILRMRKNMIDMRRQFDTILEDVAQRFRDTLKDE